MPGVPTCNTGVLKLNNARRLDRYAQLAVTRSLASVFQNHVDSACKTKSGTRALKKEELIGPGIDFAFDRHDRLLNAVFQSHVAIKETTMQWTTPAYSDLRFGFEIAMYIANR